jgi:hypothetical protein
LQENAYISITDIRNSLDLSIERNSRKVANEWIENLNQNVITKSQLICGEVLKELEYKFIE